MPVIYTKPTERRDAAWLKSISLDQVTPVDLRNVYVSAGPAGKQRDTFSAMGEWQLAEVIGPTAHRLCLDAFPTNETRRRMAMRWIARGASPVVSICKVFCDLETSLKKGTNKDECTAPKL